MEDSPVEHGGRALVEGIAVVISVDADIAWMEPEQTSSCGGCASAKACGVKTGGLEGRLKARRFPMRNTADLRVGERVVVGIPEDALLRASLVAYAIPLLGMVGGSMVVNLTIGGDVATAIAAVVGLGLGILVARGRAKVLSAKGDITPRFIRHAWPNETCHTV